jgi:hypothetical protein
MEDRKPAKTKNYIPTILIVLLIVVIYNILGIAPGLLAAALALFYYKDRPSTFERFEFVLVFIVCAVVASVLLFVLSYAIVYLVYASSTSDIELSIHMAGLIELVAAIAIFVYLWKIGLFKKQNAVSKPTSAEQ